jgi:hypothetical protein
VTNGRNCSNSIVQIRPKLIADPHAECMLDLESAAQELRRMYESGAITEEELPAGVFELTERAEAAG